MIRFPMLGGILCLAALAGCGNQTEVSPLLTAMKGAAKAVTAGKGAAPAAPAQVTRADLVKLGVPVIKGEMKTGNSTFYIVPIAVKGDVQTWSTSDDVTLTFRNGVLAETRGFGPDIMQSTGPSLSQLRAGGSHQRSYVYLDGGDQLIRLSYDCRVTFAGAETITVVAQQHSTTRVVEDCTGKQGNFTNEYWFEKSGKLRKSKELLVPAWGYLDLARVVDGT